MSRAGRLASPGEPVSRRQTRTATALVLVAGLVAAVAGVLAEGPAGLASGLLGAVVVLAFFHGGLAPLRLVDTWGDKAGPGVLFVLLNYAFRLVAIFVVLAAGTSLGVHGPTLGLTVIGCALVWVIAQVAVGMLFHDPLDLEPGSLGGPEA